MSEFPLAGIDIFRAMLQARNAVLTPAQRPGTPITDYPDPLNSTDVGARNAMERDRFNGGRLLVRPETEQDAEAFTKDMLSKINVGGLPAASMRRFAAGIDPAFKLSEQGTQHLNLLKLYDHYFTKNKILDTTLHPNDRKRLIQYFADNYGASGLKADSGLRQYTENNKDLFGTQSPHTIFTTDPTEATALHGIKIKQITSNPGANSAAFVRTANIQPRHLPKLADTGKRTTTAVDLRDPSKYDSYFEVAAEEGGSHAITPQNLDSRLPRYLGGKVDVQRAKDVLEGKPVIHSTMPSRGVMQPVKILPLDKLAIEQYIKDQRNVPWKTRYQGAGNPEHDVLEYMEALYRPVFEPRRRKYVQEMESMNPNSTTKVTDFADSPGKYWEAWNLYPDVFLQLHKDLGLKVPKVIRKKLGLDVTPEQVDNLSMFEKMRADAASKYSDHMSGKPLNDRIDFVGR